MEWKVKIESDLINLRVVESTIYNVANEIKISRDSYSKILVAALEAVNNAILHGNHLNKEKFVEIIISYDNNIFSIVVIDEGKGFVFDMLPDPTAPENIEVLNGRGVYLMSRLADDIMYNGKGNIVTMIFNDVVS